MFPKILVATDFSENANRAIAYAVDLAKELNSSVTIMNVVPNKIPFGMSGAEVAVIRGEDYLKGLKRINEAKIATIIKDIKKKKSSMVIAAIVKIGNPVQEISSAAKGFDILVIGHKGESNLLDAFTGTTSERIVHGATFPVIVVP